jgi:hypothetical protein
MIRKLNDERGLAMVTGIMVSLVILIFSIAVVDLASHNMRSSDRDRKRVDAVATAEAGLDATMSAIQTAVIDISGGNYTLPCTVNASMPQAPSSQYTVTVNYYATYPPTGSPMACPPTSPPAGATLTSVGNAVTNSPTSVTRTMAAQVRLSPVYGAVGGNAIFSDSGLNLQNQLTVNGNVGNDGNLYTNGDFLCNNNSNIAGSLLVQGAVTLSSSCTFNQDVYAKGAISMSNSALVGHDVTSSNSSLVMANTSHINHNVVTAVGTCSSCTTGAGGRVGGTVTTGHISPPPPKLTMPQIDYVPSAWTDAGFQIITYSDCSAARTAIAAGWTSPTVVRITPACSLSFNGDTLNMKNDVAIMADGPIAFSNHNTIQSADSNKRTLYLIEPTNGISNPDCTVTNRNIDISNNTDFVGVYLFAYSQCTVTYNNNNSGLGGQIIGGTVNIQNLYSLTFHPITIPGGVITGFNEDLAFMREIVNS